MDVLPAHDEGQDDENAFWTGRSGGKPATKGAPTVEYTEENKFPSSALLKYRIRVPVSPPPSRRAPQVQPRSSSVQRSLSRSPPPSLLPILPTLDSPDNPFLASDDEACTSKASGWESSDYELLVGEARERESTPTPTSAFEERPTITYVLCVSLALIMFCLLTSAIAAAKKRLSITRNMIFLLKLLRHLNCLSTIQTLKWRRHVRPAVSSPAS